MNEREKHNAAREGAGGEERERLLNALLDGEASEAEVARFEELAREDEGLRAELEHGRAADAWLRERFAPPEALARAAGMVGVNGRVAGRIAVDGGEAKSLRGRRWLPWGAGIAAALAIGVGVQYGLLGGGGGAWWKSGAPELRERFVRGDAAGFLKGVEEAGYKPQWVCGDAKELAEYTGRMLGQRWTIDEAPGLTLVGWTYTDRVLSSNYSHVLLAEYEGEHVVVVADRADLDREVFAPEGSGVRVHRRVMGDVVVYEVSKMEEAVVLGRIGVE